MRPGRTATDPRLAALTTPRSDIEAAYEDVAPHRDQTPAERVSEAARLSRLALAFMDRFPEEERWRLLWSQEELDPAALAAWKDLVRGHRGC